MNQHLLVKMPEQLNDPELIRGFISYKNLRSKIYQRIITEQYCGAALEFEYI
jgi:hypothetical protein